MFIARGFVAVIATMAVVASAGAQQRRPDLNAFLNRKATTTAELVNQARNDPQVMDRYMRHFGMNRQEVLAYLGSLRVSRIQQDGVYQIFSVPEGGQIKVRTARLTRGTPVFAQQDGTPVMILLCGNPLSMGPKDVVAVGEYTPELIEEVPNVEEMVLVEDAAPEVQPIASVEPRMPDVPAIETIPDTTGGSPIGFGGAGPLGLLAALGGGIGLASGGGNGQPIPEPATMLALAGGIAAIAARRRRKSSK